MIMEFSLHQFRDSIESLKKQIIEIIRDYPLNFLKYLTIEY